LRGLAEMQERADEERIEVEFTSPGEGKEP
jgi:hypothetical protein